MTLHQSDDVFTLALPLTEDQQMAKRKVIKKVNVNARITPGEQIGFRSACKRNGFDQSKVLRKLMQDFTNGNITYTIEEIYS